MLYNIEDWWGFLSEMHYTKANLHVDALEVSDLCIVIKLILIDSAEMQCCVNLCFRAIDLETVKILRARVQECQRREEVNHPERCREHVERYFQAFKKYRSEGAYLILCYSSTLLWLFFCFRLVPVSLNINYSSCNSINIVIIVIQELWVGIWEGLTT